MLELAEAVVVQELELVVAEAVVLVQVLVELVLELAQEEAGLVQVVVELVVVELVVAELEQEVRVWGVVAVVDILLLP